MKHVFLSPHLDDAILSCGGLMFTYRNLGESVEVVNLCAGTPDYSRLSSFARNYHIAWDNLTDPVAARHQEDSAVLGRWGVVSHCFDTLDSIYRCAEGLPLYPDVFALFADPHPLDVNSMPSEWHRQFRLAFGQDEAIRVYGPLAAGNHVDHQLGRLFALELLEQGFEVWFYEDFPHAERYGAIDEARSWFGLVNWESYVIPIDVRAKIEAIRGYRTQIRSLFEHESALEHRVKVFTAEVACEISRGERLRRSIAGLGGRRERLWRNILGYHGHAERFWGIRYGPTN